MLYLTFDTDPSDLYRANSRGFISRLTRSLAIPIAQIVRLYPTSDMRLGDHFRTDSRCNASHLTRILAISIYLRANSHCYISRFPRILHAISIGQIALIHVPPAPASPGSRHPTYRSDVNATPDTQLTSPRWTLLQTPNLPVRGGRYSRHPAYRSHQTLNLPVRGGRYSRHPAGSLPVRGGCYIGQRAHLFVTRS